MCLSAGSMPSANAGKLSDTRFINKIWVAVKKVAEGMTREMMKSPKTSTRLVESKNIIVFVMF